ncbi:hypothetical protein ACFPRL_35695 [Pseudoclavibacter helvolus]
MQERADGGHEHRQQEAHSHGQENPDGEKAIEGAEPGRCGGGAHETPDLPASAVDIDADRFEYCHHIDGCQSDREEFSCGSAFCPRLVTGVRGWGWQLADLDSGDDWSRVCVR